MHVSNGLADFLYAAPIHLSTRRHCGSVGRILLLICARHDVCRAPVRRSEAFHFRFKAQRTSGRAGRLLLHRMAYGLRPDGGAASGVGCSSAAWRPDPEYWTSEYAPTPSPSLCVCVFWRLASRALHISLRCQSTSLGRQRQRAHRSVPPSR